jgi:hypothetical protein
MASGTTGPLKEDTVIRAALRGIVCAQRDYEKWNGDWLWHAPEYFSTVYVAREIAKYIDGEFLTIENGTESAIRDAGARGKGRLHRKMRPKGRMDLLLWWATTRKPRCVIEIKRHVTNFKGIRSDAQRIEKILQRRTKKNTIHTGMIVFYASCCCRRGEPKAKLTKRIEAIRDTAASEFYGSLKVSCRSTPVEVEGDSAWAAVLLVFKPSK